MDMERSTINCALTAKLGVCFTVSQVTNFTSSNLVTMPLSCPRQTPHHAAANASELATVNPTTAHPVLMTC